ncbi:MAG TPA: hypothetical protein VH475_08465 [Tepidisphaeraceae bacterium]
MIQIPANLGQRILDAARIAAAMHEEAAIRDRQQKTSNERIDAGGAGRVVSHDDPISRDGTAATPRPPQSLGLRWSPPPPPPRIR